MTDHIVDQFGVVVGRRRRAGDGHHRCTGALVAPIGCTTVLSDESGVVDAYQRVTASCRATSDLSSVIVVSSSVDRGWRGVDDSCFMKRPTNGSFDGVPINVLTAQSEENRKKRKR